MVIIHCPSSHCHLSINQFHLNLTVLPKLFTVKIPDDGQTDKAATTCFDRPPLGSIKTLNKAYLEH